MKNIHVGYKVHLCKLIYQPHYTIKNTLVNYTYVHYICMFIDNEHFYDVNNKCTVCIEITTTFMML